METDYKELLAELAALLALNPEQLQETQSFEFRGKQVSLAWLPVSGMCRATIPLGAPERDTVAGLRWMLGCNSDTSMALLPVLALDAAGEVVLNLHVPIWLPGAAQTLAHFLEQDLEFTSSLWRSGLVARGMETVEPVRFDLAASV